MKKSIIFIILVLTIVFAVNYVNAEYTPPPGVRGPEEVDFAGETVTIVSTMTPLDQVRDDGLWAGRLEEAEKLFNVKFAEVTADWWSLEDLIYSRVLAGESTNDIFYIQNIQGMWRFLADGMFYPVSAFLPSEYFAYQSETDQRQFRTATVDNNYYAFGRTFARGNITQSFHFSIYNKNILEKEGLPDPRDLYEEGNWTWQAADEIIREVTKDTTGDGIIDQFGLERFGTPQTEVFVTTNDVFPIIREDGRFLFNLNQPAAYEALQQIQDWIPYMVPQGQNPRDLFFDNRLALIMRSTIPDTRHYTAEMEPNEWGIVPLPIGPEAVGPRFANRRLQTNFLPIIAENPENLVALHSYLFRPDDTVVQWQDWLPSREMYDFIRDSILNYWEEDDHIYFVGSHIMAPANIGFGDVLYRNESPATAMDAIALEAQAALDDLFSQ